MQNKKPFIIYLSTIEGEKKLIARNNKGELVSVDRLYEMNNIENLLDNSKITDANVYHNRPRKMSDGETKSATCYEFALKKSPNIKYSHIQFVVEEGMIIEGDRMWLDDLAAKGKKIFIKNQELIIKSLRSKVRKLEITLFATISIATTAVVLKEEIVEGVKETISTVMDSIEESNIKANYEHFKSEMLERIEENLRRKEAGEPLLNFYGKMVLDQELENQLGALTSKYIKEDGLDLKFNELWAKFYREKGENFTIEEMKAIVEGYDLYSKARYRAEVELGVIKTK